LFATNSAGRKMRREEQLALEILLLLAQVAEKAEELEKLTEAPPPEVKP
jgi:hypothetical protein